MCQSPGRWRFSCLYRPGLCTFIVCPSGGRLMRTCTSCIKPRRRVGSFAPIRRQGFSIQAHRLLICSPLTWIVSGITPAVFDFMVEPPALSFAVAPQPPFMRLVTPVGLSVFYVGNRCLHAGYSIQIGGGGGLRVCGPPARAQGRRLKLVAGFVPLSPYFSHDSFG
jgi:hypothetical protein